MKDKVAYLYHGKVQLYGLNSLFIFKPGNPIRKLCAWLIEWDPFEYFILSIILANSITLSIYDYSDRDSLTEFNKILDILGIVFTIIFTIEAVI